MGGLAPQGPTQPLPRVLLPTQSPPRAARAGWTRTLGLGSVRHEGPGAPVPAPRGSNPAMADTAALPAHPWLRVCPPKLPRSTEHPKPARPLAHTGRTVA